MYWNDPIIQFNRSNREAISVRYEFDFATVLAPWPLLVKGTWMTAHQIFRWVVLKPALLNLAAAR
jgi:hypothetical protein